MSGELSKTLSDLLIARKEKDFQQQILFMENHISIIK